MAAPVVPTTLANDTRPHRAECEHECIVGWASLDLPGYQYPTRDRVDCE